MESPQLSDSKKLKMSEDADANSSTFTAEPESLDPGQANCDDQEVHNVSAGSTGSTGSNLMSQSDAKKLKMTGDNLPTSSAESEREQDLCDFTTSDFEIIKRTSTFMDKSLFIKAFFNADRIVLITAPRRFGKSTLMDMLKQFLLGKTTLFENLNIRTTEEAFFSQNCRLHPVIHLDLAMVIGNSYVEVLQNFGGALRRTFNEHDYLLQKSTWSSEKLKNSVLDAEAFLEYCRKASCTELSAAKLYSGLEFLCEVLHKHYEQKVFLLIDDYDSPVMKSLLSKDLDKNETEKIINFFRSFMAQTLMFNAHKERTLINACTGIAGVLSGDASTVIKHYPFPSEPLFASYFGFTSEEVKALLERPVIKKFYVDSGTIDEWYNGYTVAGDNTKKVYNSWSVLHHLMNSKVSGETKFDSYWFDNYTNYVKNLKELVSLPIIRGKIEELIADKQVMIKTVKSVSLEHFMQFKKLINLELDEPENEDVDFFLQFLSDYGYFNLLPSRSLKQQNTEKSGDEQNMEEHQASLILKVPNEEIKIHLRSICHKVYKKALSKLDHLHLDSEHVKGYFKALTELLEDNGFIRPLSEFANAIATLFSGEIAMDYNEAQLMSVLSVLVSNCRFFDPQSELQIRKGKKGCGRASGLDIIILKNSGIIVEISPESFMPKPEDIIAFHHFLTKHVYEPDYSEYFQQDGFKFINKKNYARIILQDKFRHAFLIHYVDGEETACIGRYT